ncbi:MAG: lysine 2,3-aminomutase [SAR324 cluster bacterium]|nr:lysine 2,3-aminomutase [SAR324 cluster bacterium]
MSHPTYKAYSLSNMKEIPQIRQFTDEQKFEMEVVGHVFPFKTNNYVVDQLINWEDVPNDPIFQLTFPQKGMLKNHHFERMSKVLRAQHTRSDIQKVANTTRWNLNPHPAGQTEYNRPMLNGVQLDGLQHKYRKTVLAFPSKGQTCHAYCTFCFRWPQFVGINELKFAMQETKPLIEYIRQHPEISDVLFTGGDPLIMNASSLAVYVNELLEANLPHLKTIRLGTKSLSFWPYRFLTDPDTRELLDLFKKIVKSGKHLALMAHFNHPRELQTEAVQEAIRRIQETGALIRTQSPLLNYINNRAEVWAEMWTEQVRLGCIPYYMFVVRDTGAQHHFGIPLIEALSIFKMAYQQVSGLARTVRGPSMSTTPGKIHLLGVQEIKGEKVFVMQFIQARNPTWTMHPFFAQYNDKANWLDGLSPAFGAKHFFFEDSSSKKSWDDL